MSLSAAFDPDHPRYPQFETLRALYLVSAAVREVIECIRVKEGDPHIRLMLKEIGRLTEPDRRDPMIGPHSGA